MIVWVTPGKVQTAVPAMPTCSLRLKSLWDFDAIGFDLSQVTVYLAMVSSESFVLRVDGVAGNGYHCRKAKQNAFAKEARVLLRELVRCGDPCPSIHITSVIGRTTRTMLLYLVPRRIVLLTLF
ncbi:unnamed protein product [Pylaiella littoralis]